MDSEENKKSAVVKWIKRVGIWGVVFFTVKGLLWLLVPAVLVWWGAQ